MDLQEKIDQDLALNRRELALATGYNRNAIRAMGLPFFEGKIRLSDFWRHAKKIGRKNALRPTVAELTKAYASPESLNDLRLTVGKWRVPSKKSARKVASQPLAESPPHSIA